MAQVLPKKFILIEIQNLPEVRLPKNSMSERTSKDIWVCWMKWYKLGALTEFSFESYAPGTS